MALTVFGYRYSIYTRIVRLVLHEKRLRATLVEIDPFADPDPAFLELNPFGRVPVLTHGLFTIYETAPICRYLDEALPGPPLQPGDARERARMAQVIQIADAYGYGPMVRQVYEHLVFRPAEGSPADPAIARQGLESAVRALDALERVAVEGRILDGSRLTLADLHLAAMMEAFVAAPEGAALLRAYPALSQWWGWVRTRPSLTATAPDLPVRPLEC